MSAPPPQPATGYVGDRYVPSAAQRAQIAEAVRALPPLPDDALDDIAATLANIRRKTRRQGAA